VRQKIPAREVPGRHLVHQCHSETVSSRSSVLTMVADLACESTVSRLAVKTYLTPIADAISAAQEVKSARTKLKHYWAGELMLLALLSGT
jgi:hypothetical protein